MFNIFNTIKSAARNTAKFIMSTSPHRLTSSEEKAYWGDAHGYSADGMITPEFRRTWRNRARYETNCNSYARGLVLTLADVGIGTGARLQLLTEDKNYNSRVEQEFAAWAETINLGQKLKTLRKAKCIDGEAFAIIVNNPKVKHEVTMDLRIIESDRVATPYPTFRQRVDGIHYDKYGNPESYDVLKEHPGSLFFSLFNEIESIPAEFMLHWYRQDRPEQSRGVTELMPSLPLFAQIRRYTLAVIEAAETAANIAAVVTANGSDARTMDFFKDNEYDSNNPKSIELRRNQGLFLPTGWDIHQLDAKQPATNYQMFKREILSEIGRCLQIPTNIILGDSSNYNYASGRLDHQIFYKSIKNEQEHCEKIVLFPLLEMWYREAVRVGLFKDFGISQISSQYARFYWDGL
ncbi:MAG: phage portal protein, partial [Planctomycetaceae bacterium]|nr:phage portal protein [Planctomycetaceae bacterium]